MSLVEGYVFMATVRIGHILSTKIDGGNKSTVYKTWFRMMGKSTCLEWKVDLKKDQTFDVELMCE